MNMLPSNLEAARPHLRPLLRGRWHLAATRLQAQLDDVPYSGDAACMDFSADAQLLLGYDLPDQTITVDADALRTWGLSFREALPLAMKNLRSSSPPQFRPLEGGVWTSDWSDGYDSSRILLPDVMGQSGVQGDFVMMIPSRRAGVLVAPAASIEAQLHLLGFARQVIEERGGIISTVLYRYKDRRVAAFEPDNAHLARKLSELQKLGWSSLYQEQKNALEHVHSRQAQPPFVASYQVAQAPGGWLSACSWTKGQDTLLPKTDIVNLVTLDPRGGNEHQVKILAWETAQAIASTPWQPIDTFPPRFLATGFPAERDLWRAEAFQL
jgi:hypothetical protein